MPSLKDGEMKGAIPVIRYRGMHAIETLHDVQRDHVKTVVNLSHIFGVAKNLQ